ncbi:stalk domain-containing protein [Paenibacillus piri]|uniref:DUF5050 domain-containing protein n=1 Tax=Paenibacillus piri TaxID=2547395 RepID=A0A4R5L099_9BACL|nr:stalk domain-containing protein [Paenibacillus piri]TDG00916.1 DUF5050 domain-containing protein [Paenibacillus piri]
MKVKSKFKKQSTLLCGAVLAGVLLFGIGNTASAETPVTVEINGKVQTFSQPALIKGGSTLVPLRAIFEALGAEIEWDGKLQRVVAQKGAQLIELTINKSTASINGETITLAVNAEIINGNTMVPLRFVAEALGADVSFNNDTRKVSITSVKTISTLEQKVNEIYSSIIDASMTDFQKVYAFNKYLANNVIYDYNNYMNDTIPKESFTPEGALLKGFAVCQGYTEAMKLFLDKAKIENRIITGEVPSDKKSWEMHTWNLVKLDGEYYHVDSTWNDRDLKRKDTVYPAPYGDVDLDYFLVSDNFIYATHRFQKDKYPKSGTKFDKLFGDPLATGFYFPVYESKNNIIVQRANSNSTVSLVTIDKDGKEVSGALAKEQINGFLNEIVIDNHLFYTVDQRTGEHTIDLYRVTLDGKDKTLVAKDMNGQPKIIGGNVYYYSTWYDPARKLPSKTSIHRVSLSTGEDKVLLEDVRMLSVSNNYIYYEASKNMQVEIHRVTLEGTSDTVIAKNIDFGNYLFSDNYLFYVEALDYSKGFDQNSRIHDLQLDSLKDTLLFEDKQVTFMGFKDGVLTYRAGTQTKTVKVGS